VFQIAQTALQLLHSLCNRSLTGCDLFRQVLLLFYSFSARYMLAPSQYGGLQLVQVVRGDQHQFLFLCFLNFRYARSYFGTSARAEFLLTEDIVSLQYKLSLMIN
jgi:hypothetical protein